MVFAYARVLDERGTVVHDAWENVAFGVRGEVGRIDVRYTTDGTAAGPDSPRYEAPVGDAERLRATLFVDGEPVVGADSAADRFRIAGSVAPEPE